MAGASPQTLNTLLDIVESEMDTLAGLDMLHEITKALYIAYEHQKRLGLSDRRLLELLVGLEQTLLLDPLSKAAVATDWNMLISVSFLCFPSFSSADFHASHSHSRHPMLLR